MRSRGQPVITRSLDSFVAVSDAVTVKRRRAVKQQGPGSNVPSRLEKGSKMRFTHPHNEEKAAQVFGQREGVLASGSMVINVALEP